MIELVRAHRAALGWTVATLTGFVVLMVLVVLPWPVLVAADHAVVAATDAALAGRPGLVSAVTVVTDAGSPLAIDVVTGLVGVLLLVERRVRAAAYVVVVRVVELALETAVKNVVDRPRPVPAVVLDVAQGAAFPSGHTAGTAAFCASMLVLVLPVLRQRVARVTAVAVAAVAITAVAASRVLLAVHYPSDVVAGALLGIACAAALAPIRPDPSG